MFKNLNFPRDLYEVVKSESLQRGETAVVFDGEYPGWFFPQLVVNGVDTFQPGLVVIYSRDADIVTTWTKRCQIPSNLGMALYLLIYNAFDNGATSVELRPWAQ